MEFIDRSRPEPAAHEALVEIDFAGLCGSDAGIYEFESAFECALRLIDSGDVDCETLIDDRFSPEDAEEAFESFIDGETCKPVLDVSQVWD